MLINSIHETKIANDIPNVVPETPKYICKKKVYQQLTIMKGRRDTPSLQDNNTVRVDFPGGTGLSFPRTCTPSDNTMKCVPMKH